MQTLTSEIDEALRHLSQVPPADRGDAWYAYLDAVLEQRTAMGSNSPSHRPTMSRNEGGHHGPIQPQATSNT